MEASMPAKEAALARLLPALTAWATAREDIVGVALVGSYARGEARPHSDVDLVILAAEPARYVEQMGWIGRFGEVTSLEVEEWGPLTSLRVRYAEGLEVEFGLTSPAWAALPLDGGSARVLSDGARILLDREGRLAAALAAL